MADVHPPLDDSICSKVRVGRTFGDVSDTVESGAHMDSVEQRTKAMSTFMEKDEY